METILKVYTCDFGWMGGIVVLATSEEEARKLMECCENYCCKASNGQLPCIEELPLEVGIVHCNYGDL